jgi:hypothetical protein
MKNRVSRSFESGSTRRAFLKRSAVTAGASTLGAGLFERSFFAFGQEGPEEKSGKLTSGDAALLRFAAAAEILETDFWVQYNELEVSLTRAKSREAAATPHTPWPFKSSMGTCPQYIHHNTDDEFTHQNFLNAYLVSKGADPVSCDDRARWHQPLSCDGTTRDTS